MPCGGRELGVFEKLKEGPGSYSQGQEVAEGGENQTLHRTSQAGWKLELQLQSRATGACVSQCFITVTKYPR